MQRTDVVGLEHMGLGSLGDLDGLEVSVLWLENFPADRCSWAITYGARESWRFEWTRSLGALAGEFPSPADRCSWA